MSCNCTNKVAILVCPDCKTIQTLSYEKGADPQKVLEDKPRKCLKCKCNMELRNG